MHYKEGNMKKALIAMLLMAIFLIGGGVEQSYIYPIYGAIIVLTGVIVGAAQVIVNEIRNQKNKENEDRE